MNAEKDETFVGLKVFLNPDPSFNPRLNLNPSFAFCLLIRFDCPNLIDHDNSKCYFKNQTLSPGDVLENFQQSDTCEAKCYCNLNRGGGPSEILCARLRCSEKFPADQKVKYCLKQYDHENCCPVKNVCGKYPSRAQANSKARDNFS